MSYANMNSDGTFSFKGKLPKSYKNISGFDNLPVEKLKEFDWYVVEETSPVNKDWEEYVKSYELQDDDIIRPVYTYNNISLEDYKTKRNDVIKQAFANTLISGCEISAGYKVDCKPDDLANWTTNYNHLTLSDATTTIIRDYDNVVRELSIEEYKVMVVEIGDYIKSLMSNKWTKQAMIENATTFEEVENVNW